MQRIDLKFAVLGLIVTALALPVPAQQPPPEIPPPGTPSVGPDDPLPPKINPEDGIEPSVIIRDEEDRTIEEYRQNGQLYMVKVTPKNGIPYYYMDEDGDGQLELQPGDDIGPVRPAFWKIKEW